ncbi:SnoaL-like domain protein [Planctomycetes bacterium Poly30]|uniref:SnoaL-like domain protein n=1 Tax=Saltatorellus ferox TaxID=2528018 RepID=A0A518ESY5_9BACT|nr:SnoaL-like domain protein [Planctomycetes bacterium Poly30]
MHPNEALLHEFYGAFARRDASAMAAAYADDARFSDPVFPNLDASEVRAMWKMLLERGKDLAVTFGGISADDARGKAHWEATYTFSATGRTVHNVIDATFEFRDGKIVRHVDAFDFWRWSRMALGAKGTLLGWTPLVRNKVRETAARQLAKAK